MHSSPDGGPRFASSGREVHVFEGQVALAWHLRRLRRARWFRRQGALVQELVPRCGFELRLIVCADTVVGATAEVANTASQRVAARCGFVFVCREGEELRFRRDTMPA